MARRLTKSAIDWVKFSELVPKEHRANFAALKSKSDNYVRVVHELPETLPAIDFSYYKSRIANPKIAEDFEQKYKALQVPYPEDKYSKQIDAMAEQQKKYIADFIANSQKRIQELKAEAEKLDNMIPLEHMTMEDFAEVFPDEAWNPDKPTWYPHDRETNEAIRQSDEEIRLGIHKNAH